MNKETLMRALGTEDRRRSKEGHGRKDRFMCGQAPGEAMESRLARTTRVTEIEGPETGWSEQACDEDEQHSQTRCVHGPQETLSSESRKGQ